MRSYGPLPLAGKQCMPIPFRTELKQFLDEFVEQYRGVRLGKMFGLPAIYVGRNLVTCLMEDGIIVRLPEDIARQEIRKKAEAYSRRGRALGSWVLYRPRTVVEARRLTPILEIAARNIAERQAEDMTGVRLRRK
jgi:hypothetical protein